MVRITDRRRPGLRNRLARLLFSLARNLAGPTPRHWDYYARRIDALQLVDAQITKVITVGALEPDTHRDALLRLATEIGRVKREGLIIRLALDDAGILLLPPEERSRLENLYIKGD